MAFHNIWHGLPGLIVTLIGWGLAIKSTIYFLFPRFGVRMLGVSLVGTSLALRRRRCFQRGVGSLDYICTHW